MTYSLTLVDNDALIKLSAYSLWRCIQSAAVLPEPFGVLGAARYVVPSAIERSERIKDRDGALSAWEAMLDLASELEPTNDELRLATEMEDAANERGLPLDVGESQLCAMAVYRLDTLVLTGDKRALEAVENLRSVVGRLPLLDGRIACLEQLLQALLHQADAMEIRALVCAEPRIDKTLSICFSCTNHAEVDSMEDAGLVSYILDLRTSAPNVLMRTLAS